MIPNRTEGGGFRRGAGPRRLDLGPGGGGQGPVKHRRKRPVTVREQGPSSRNTDALLFAGSFLLFLAGAYLIAFQFRYAQGDALSRTYSAMAAVHSANPHLGAIGFIWPPLLTLAQLPLVVLKPLTYYGFSGMIVTACFGAVSLLALERFYRRYGLGFWHRLILAVLFALNPFIFYYSATGMSEILFVFFFVLSLSHFLFWVDNKHWQHMALAGMTVGASFYVRYDAMALALAIFLAVAVLLPRFGQQDYDRMEGTLLAYTVPVAYGMSVWVFLNWLIMHDPLFFYSSEYSNLYLTRNVRSLPQVLAMQASLQATMEYTVQKIYAVSPYFIFVAPLLVIIGLVRRNLALIMAVAICLSVILFQVYMFRQGTTFGFDRFYISLIPSSFILYVVLHRRLAGLRAVFRHATTAVLLLGLAASTGLTSWNMIQTGTAQPEGVLLNAVLNWQAVGSNASDEVVAAYIKEHVKGRQILSFSDTVILFTQDPRMFVVDSDPDFGGTLRDPVGRIDYLLVNNPDKIGFDPILSQYPTLWEKGADFVTLEQDFGAYRLYRVVDPDESAGGATPVTTPR